MVTLQVYRLGSCFDCLAEYWLLFYFGSTVFLTFLPVSLWRLCFCWSCFCVWFFFFACFPLLCLTQRLFASLIFVFLFRLFCPLCASHKRAGGRVCGSRFVLSCSSFLVLSCVRPGCVCGSHLIIFFMYVLLGVILCARGRFCSLHLAAISMYVF